MTLLTEDKLQSLCKIVWGEHIREDVFQRWSQGITTNSNWWFQIVV